MSPQPSRAVTRAKCAVCGNSFTAGRRDARYCSGRCRQRALRARAEEDDLLRQIDEARRHYWACVRRYAEAFGRQPDEAQLVDAEGQVFIRGELVGHAHFQDRPGWSTWGNENAGPPWSPPTDWIHENFGPARVERDPAYREHMQAIARDLGGDGS